MAIRFDIGGLRKPVKTPQGFLRVDAYITRTGIFEYKRADGTTVREYRDPSEVFDAQTLESFALAPVTNLHPPEMVTTANVKQYACGSAGEPTREGDKVRTSMLITDEALIAAMEGGQKQVSCGYLCDVEMTPGENQYGKYDAVQRRIRGNHIAVVPTGRAGESIAARMDDAAWTESDMEVEDAVWSTADKNNLPDSAFLYIAPGGKKDSEGKTVPRSLRHFPVRGMDGKVDLPHVRDALSRIPQADVPPAVKQRCIAQAQHLLQENRKDGRSMATIKFDGIEFEVSTEAAQAFSKLEGRIDAATEQVTKLQSDLKSLEATIPARVQARVALEKTAVAALGAEAKVDSMSDKDIKLAVIAKAGKPVPAERQDDAGYVDGRFDGAVTSLAQDDQGAARQTIDASVKAPTVDAACAKVEAARVKARADLADAWKQPIPGSVTK